MNTFHSISAIPAYSKKSFEELRWEDYQQGKKGIPGFGTSTVGQVGFGIPSGATSSGMSFGQQPASSMSFGSTLFGGTTGSGFGTSANVPSTSGALFGSSSSNAPGSMGGTSLFGTSNIGSSFGGTSNIAPATGTTLFGIPQSAMPQTQDFGFGSSLATSSNPPTTSGLTGSLFGQKPATTNLFGKLK